MFVKRITATATATATATDTGRCPATVRPATVAAAAMLFVAVSGCAAGDASRAVTFALRDSAGVEIVESAEPVWREGEGWRLSAEPMLDIGRTEGEQPYLLDRVMGVVRLDDGGVVVANMGDNTLRFFDAQGSFVRSVGRTGGGPGEFQRIHSLSRVGDELFVGQFSQHPTQVFALDGTFVRPIRLTEAAASAFQLVGPFDDGAQLFMTWPQGPRTEAATSVEPMVLYRVAPDGATIDSLVERPAAFYSTTDGQFRIPVMFGPSGTLRVSGDRFYYAFREAYDVEVRDRDGRLLRRVRRAWEPVPVTEAQIARYKEDLLIGANGEPLPPATLERRRRIGEETRYAERHPALASLIADRSGNLWVERLAPERSQVARAMNPTYDVPIEWDVFDPHGVWLGVVTTPAELRVYEIGDDYLTGVWRDVEDVEHVRVYALQKD